MSAERGFYSEMSYIWYASTRTNTRTFRKGISTMYTIHYTVYCVRLKDENSQESYVLVKKSVCTHQLDEGLPAACLAAFILKLFFPIFSNYHHQVGQTFLSFPLLYMGHFIISPRLNGEGFLWWGGGVGRDFFFTN